METMPRLVATDIGGTLSVEKHVLPAFTVRVLNRLAADGVPLALVTGFNCRTAMMYARDLDDRIHLVVQNGALCVQDRGIRWEHHLHPHLAETACRLTIETGLPVFVYRGEADDFRNYALNQAEREPGKTPIQVEALEDYENTLGVAALVPNAAVGDLHGRLEALCRGEAQVILSGGVDVSWLEVTPREARKDLALERLCGELGVSRDEAMYFGDNTNDIQALRSVGLPRVVDNAIGELKREFPAVGQAGVEGVAHYLAALFGLDKGGGRP